MKQALKITFFAALLVSIAIGSIVVLTENGVRERDKINAMEKELYKREIIDSVRHAVYREVADSLCNCKTDEQ